VSRAFIAIRPPESVLDAIAALPAVPGRATTRDQWHVTLQFLGNVEDLDAIQLDLETRAGIAQFGGSGSFPGVIWLGLRQGSEMLSALALEIGVQLGVQDQRQYHPHLTLSRLKDRARPKLPELGAVGGEWRVDEVTLYESTLKPTGAEYRAIAKFPLR
jgi:2'-5' RNA ligase